MDSTHWNAIYAAKTAEQVTWYQPHLALSLGMIERATSGDRDAAIIDVGGGESTLIDDLWAAGYRKLTLVDLSPTAVECVRHRHQAAGIEAKLISGDVTSISLPEHAIDVWHDRAVFHFLTSPDAQRAYLSQLERALSPRGQLVIATFALDGPSRCSGLDVVRYSANSLGETLGPSFRLVEHSDELHHTPSGITQAFNYCRFTFTGPSTQALGGEAGNHRSTSSMT